MRVKRRIYSGAVCEQIVYTVPDGLKNLEESRPARPRFQTEEDRARHRDSVARRRNARIVNANFGDASSLARYGTLTFDDEHEVHTFPEARRVRDRFYRAIRRKYPKARIMIYMGRGEHTARIHFHILIDGVPEEFIREKWIYGSVIRLDPMREHNYYNGVDCGRDYTGLANYLFNHWTPEQGGNRWKGSRSTLRKAECEKPTEAKRVYTMDHPPRAPKGYKLVESMETPYGFLYYKYVRIPEKRTRRKTGQE